MYVSNLTISIIIFIIEAKRAKLLEDFITFNDAFG